LKKGEEFYNQQIGEKVREQLERKAKISNDTKASRVSKLAPVVEFGIF